MIRCLAAVAIAASLLVVGCRLPEDTNDFPTTGFARVRGTVLRPDGTAFGDVPVSLSCGPQAPGVFLSDARADNAGAYRIDAGAPDPFGPPPGVAEVTLICRLHASMSTLGSEADSIVSVRFAADRTNAPLLIVDLQTRTTSK